jgi:hypothetical protein
MRHVSRIAGPLLVLITAAVGRPAFAQIDLSGEWGGTFHEDLPHRGGMQLGDYTGLPLNEAGWRKAQSWDEAVVATHERQSAFRMSSITRCAARPPSGFQRSSIRTRGGSSRTAFREAMAGPG